MKAKFILELDPRDSLESNLDFLKNCEKQIELRRQRLIDLHKKPIKIIKDKKYDIKDI